MRASSRPDADVAGRIRRLRSGLCFTQSQLADAMGVSLLTIHRWESRKSKPRVAALRRVAELEERLALADPSKPRAAVLGPPPLDFAGNPDAISAFAEATFLVHGHEFNPAFAIETSRIDPLPHQRIAVYERMLSQDPIRFLLADDAGAGKTIMTGLLVRELLSRRRIARVLVVPPAGLVGNWERELRSLFRLRFRIYESGAGSANAFVGTDGDLVIVSVDTLRGDGAFRLLCEPDVAPYDLVVFDEAHKLGVNQTGTRIRKTLRYRLAEGLAGCARPQSPFARLPWSARHLLLLTATPHMGRDTPYHALWRLLDPRAFAAGEAVRRLSRSARQRHFLRRTKEEMVTLEGEPLYVTRHCDTLGFRLSPGERDLYDRTTAYLGEFYGRALSNQPAVELAKSVFQRRLVSSTWALLRSFERRIAKLRATVEAIESGEQDLRTLANQAGLPREDFFETHGADEESSATDREENEIYEDAVLGAVAAVAIEDLHREIGILRGLRSDARRLLRAGDESKFTELRQVLEGRRYGKDKWLVFSEHRDTVDYLVRRLEGLGYSGRVAQIHGGMDWVEREQQTEEFRREQGARFLIATDAAGEGINLQFCHLMVNYDIPWNPARLEQRMGRIHRYGQRHDVRIVNLVSKGTREGRVLRVLLRKLDVIRRRLSSDKVFDVIGRLLENRSLSEYMREGGRRRLEAAFNEHTVRAMSGREAAVYGRSDDLGARLPAMRSEIEREQYVRMLPAYVRRFVERSAPLLGLEVRGDLDAPFSFTPGRPGALTPLLPVLEPLNSRDRERLSVRRLPGGEPGVWLHPGEPVFDVLAATARERFSRDAQRGAIFSDPRAEHAYLFYLGLVSVETEAPPRHGILDGDPRGRLVERRLVGLRQADDGALTEEPVERMLLLHGAPGAAPGAIPLAARALVMRAAAQRQLEGIGDRLAEAHRDGLRRLVADRQRRTATGMDLRLAELARRRRTLRDRKEPDMEALRAIGEEQARIVSERSRVAREVAAAPGRVRRGDIEIVASVLVIPPGDGNDAERHDERVEEMAVRIASGWERDRGARVEDVSTPAKARAHGLRPWPGFDLRSQRPDGETRNIEVKGRVGRGSIQIETNEWKQAVQLGKSYWIYVVLDCGTSHPTLVRVQDPWKNLFARERSTTAFTIPAASLFRVAEPDDAAALLSDTAVQRAGPHKEPRRSLRHRRTNRTKATASTAGLDSRDG